MLQLYYGDQMRPCAIPNNLSTLYTYSEDVFSDLLTGQPLLTLISPETHSEIDLDSQEKYEVVRKFEGSLTIIIKDTHSDKRVYPP